jgi:hypothetical protein
LDNKLLDLLSEEIRETKNLTVAVRDEVLEVRKLAEAAMITANAAWEEVGNSKRQVDAAWELVVLTRNEISRPLWKKWFGLN